MLSAISHSLPTYLSSPVCNKQRTVSGAEDSERGAAAPYSPAPSFQRRQARLSWNQVIQGCAESLFLPGTSRVHFLNAETNLLALGEVSATISFFANEFKQSKSFFVIPRPAWACLLLTSTELSSLEATPDETEANYSRPVGRRPCWALQG